MINPYDHHWGRTELLVGAEGTAKLAAARVAVYGLGGVGGYVAEALARAGAGYLRIVDGDVVAPSNRNRQLVALESTAGQSKAAVMAARIRDINPEIGLDAHARFVTPEDVGDYIGGIDYAVDAIDMVAAKVALLAALRHAGVFTVSCMGAACKLTPRGVHVCDISETRACPLAKRVRQQLRREGVREGIACVYSEERVEANYDTQGDCHHRTMSPAPPSEPGTGAMKKALSSGGEMGDPPSPHKRFVQGSISYVPGIVGLTAAGVVVQEILAPRR